MRLRALLPFLLAGSLMSVADASEVGAGPDRAALLAAARPPAEAAVGKPVQFVVRKLVREDRWAFLLAAMQDGRSRPVDWSGTDKAQAAARGMVSDDYAALLWWGDDHRWTVVAHVAGPTDAAWADWPQTYGAPPSLIGR